MAKTVIIDSKDGTKTPFLRGILTSSLLEAGLTFEEAYQLASRIRQKLSNKAKVTTREMREAVVRELIKRDDTEVLENYTEAKYPNQSIQIRYGRHSTAAFSIVRHRQSLESSGLTTDNAILTTQLLFKELEDSDKSEFHVDELGRRTYDLLKKQFDQEAATRYLVWIDYTRSGRPLILLFGGTTGCGKSTIATEIAHRLGIIRTQSTDMLREVMRMMIPERLLPALHTSSFNAWRRLPGHSDKNATEELIVMGYNHQAELLSVPCEAVIQRALRERVSLILEGIHVSPTLLHRIPKPTDAVIVPIMLAVLKPDQLKQQLKGRGAVAPSRDSSQHYLSRFEHIWELQSYLLSEADNSAMDIINNDEDMDHTTERVMRSINEVLARSFSAEVEDIFSNP
jgi:2-phosphoglycerate kinase